MVLMFMSRKAIVWRKSMVWLAAGVLTVTALLAGCGGSNQAADAGKVKVVASLYPLAWLAEQIGGANVTVTNLTTPGSEPHDIELTPKQVAAVGEAGLVVYQKGISASVDQAIASDPPQHLLDTSTVVTMQRLSVDDSTQTPSSDASLDPHTWLDPVDMQKMAAAIADQLNQVAPTHKADTDANLATLTRELGTLNSEFSTGLAHCERRVFITSHAAFGYLATRYHLIQVGVAGLSPDEEPSPARIAQVQKLATQYKVTTIFTETLVSPALAKSIAGDLGLKTAVLDPIEGITSESAGTDYLSVMRANLAALRTANGCS